MHLFNKHKKPKVYVEVKLYTTEGKLLSTSRVFDKEWFMDDYNNHEGFEIAKAANCDHQQILSAVWMAYNEGLLHDINGNPTTGN